MSKKRVLIDGYNLALRQGTGVATYGRTLVETVLALDYDASVLYAVPCDGSPSLLTEIALFDGLPEVGTKKHKIASFLELFRGTSVNIRHINVHETSLTGVVVPPAGRPLPTSKIYTGNDVFRRAIGLFRRTGLTSTISIPNLDIAHWTYPLPMEAKGARNIYTIHDLVPLRLPYATADEKNKYYALCKWIAEQADHLVTVSESSRQDIINILGVSEDKVTNTYQPVDVSDLTYEYDSDRIRVVENLFGVAAEEYFLFFGAIEPKKNVARLLEAYLASGTKTPLIVVGAPGWGSKAEAKLISSLRALDRDGKIIWLSYLPRELLLLLISQAKATLFPSLYEGFGLPIAESLALGTPVLTSNTASMPEVAGNAAILVDPYCVRDIAGAIYQLDTDNTLRADLKNNALIRAVEFTVDRYKDRTAKLYAKLV